MQAEPYDDDAPVPLDPAPLAALFGGSAAGVGFLDPGLRYLYVNPALERINGIPAAAHLGRTPAELLPELGVHGDLMHRVLDDGRPRETTLSGHTWVASPLERRYWHSAFHRLENGGRVQGLVAIILEITDYMRQQEELEQARRRLALLDTAAVSIGTTLDMDTTCRELADFVVPALADIAAVEVFPPDIGHEVRRAAPGVLRLRRAGLAAAGELAHQMAQFGHLGEYIDYKEETGVARCLATGQPVAENRDDTGEFLGALLVDDFRAAYRALGLRGAAAVPLTARGRALGVLNLVRAGDSPDFSDDDLVVARELADRAAVDLDHARRYAHEHSVARELQRSLLSEPRGPHSHVEVATRYRPAERGVLVGGDWFDVVPLRDGRHLKAMGDVMGHGVEAAVAMSQYRSLLRLLADDDLPPHLILERLDVMVERSGLDRAATCLLAVVDRMGGNCEVASAGHLPPVFIEPGAAGARVVRVPVGPPLGTGFGGYRTASVPCGPGTVLFMYTDGLVERRGEDIDVSVGRLAGLTLPVSGRLEDLLDDVLDRFGDDAEDDIAVLASRIREGALPGR
ncbi:SpoIIE family protein phosphatase [Streptomyces sp. NBC_00654]|uniref:SpoIIE family protein phosphatase n=1 Tax=Streptomyces sp. NBC_00654 TaxID=2975799 RepID=UPI002252FF3B|nr:SpoIIE family protein phosphatase [Streptomyces sp. NBC_00654]MCX4963544.1 SpoIIE family protein phosphatase [Streptomyces sp. NBC_00654]